MKTRLAVLAVSLLGCGSSTAPMDDGTQRLDAPGIYRTWYAQVETCSGLTGDYDALVLRWTKGAITVGTDAYSGYWKPKHTIVIQETWIYNETLVKHEFLHDLLQRGDHPPEYFNGVCGDLIVR
jgi:hypothetical protein